MSTCVHVERHDGLARVTLAAPERRNALDPNMLEAITQAACDANDASVILIQGQGEVFCAGFDVRLMQDNPDSVDTLIAGLSRACQALRRCDATVVVDAQGAAVAGGCALAMTADILVARRGTLLGYPVHALGISPAVTLPVLIPAAGGFARTMVMNGRLHTAELLADKGIVHQLLASDADIASVVTPLLSRGHEAARVTKQWINELDGSHDDARFDGPVDGSRGLRVRRQESS